MREILAHHKINGFEAQGGTDKDTWHSYIEPYTELLTPLKEKACALLEIGVLTGGSSLLWHDFLPQSHLVLFDIQDSMAPNIRAALDPSRYRFEKINAYTQQGVNLAKKASVDGYDVIIEDGDHKLKSQVFVLKYYTKLLKAGGFLVIEDIQSELDLSVLKKAVPSHLSYEVIDLRAVKGRYDDLMLVVRKK